MTDLVPADKIEGIVGVARHRKAHYGRAVSAEETVYILHSRECIDSGGGVVAKGRYVAPPCGSCDRTDPGHDIGCTTPGAAT